MDTHKTLIVLAMAWMPLAGTPALADSIVLSDGSILIGTVKGLSDGKLLFDTSFAGVLTIDASTVMSILADQPLNVALSTGDRLVGKLEPNEAGDGFVVKTKFADVPITSSDVDHIWTKDSKSPEQVTLEQAIAKHQTKWGATIEAGGVMKEGNTDSLNVHGRFELRRSTSDDLLKFYLRAEYAEQDDIRNRSEIIGGADYEYQFADRWSWYARSELEFDEFENLDLRTTVATGVGYNWIRKDQVDLKTRAGIGYVHESFNNGTTENKAIADLGLALRWDILDWMRLTHDATYSPSFDGIEDYRLTFDSALTFPLGTSEVWKFKLGVLNEYDSLPAPGVKRLDNTYYSSIVLDVK